MRGTAAETTSLEPVEVPIGPTSGSPPRVLGVSRDKVATRFHGRRHDAPQCGPAKEDSDMAWLDDENVMIRSGRGVASRAALMGPRKGPLIVGANSRESLRAASKKPSTVTQVQALGPVGSVPGFVRLARSATDGCPLNFEIE